MSSPWIQIRIKTEPRFINAVRANIETLPDELFVKYYYQKLAGIGARSANRMRRTILASTTRTGERRVKKGTGIAGRVSGKTPAGQKSMYDSIGWHITKHGKNHYTLQVGWLDGTPGYAIFQEQGTSNGVAAMHALRDATEYARSEIAKLSRGGTLNSSSTDFN